MNEKNTDMKMLTKQLNELGSRLSLLVDDVRTLQDEMQRFKSQVGADISTLETMARGG